MQFLANDGRPHAALHQYNHYQWWLSAELAIEPEPKTQSLARQITAQL